MKGWLGVSGDVSEVPYLSSGSDSPVKSLEAELTGGNGALSPFKVEANRRLYPTLDLSMTYRPEGDHTGWFVYASVLTTGTPPQ